MLLQDFQPLREAGLKFSVPILTEHARDLIMEGDEISECNSAILVDGKPIFERITYQWTSHFMAASTIVLPSQKGKLLVSPSEELLIEKSVAHHLRRLKRGFQAGLLKQNRVKNADEMHLIFSIDKGKTLEFKCDKHVKNVGVVSDGDPIKMMVGLSGGPTARIEASMLIF